MSGRPVRLLTAATIAAAASLLSVSAASAGCYSGCGYGYAAPVAYYSAPVVYGYSYSYGSACNPCGGYGSYGYARPMHVVNQGPSYTAPVIGAAEGYSYGGGYPSYGAGYGYGYRGLGWRGGYGLGWRGGYGLGWRGGYRGGLGWRGAYGGYGYRAGLGYRGGIGYRGGLGYRGGVGVRVGGMRPGVVHPVGRGWRR